MGLLRSLPASLTAGSIFPRSFPGTSRNMDRLNGIDVSLGRISLPFFFGGGSPGHTLTQGFAVHSSGVLSDSASVEQNPGVATVIRPLSLFNSVGHKVQSDGVNN